MRLMQAIPTIFALAPCLSAQESEVDKRIRTVAGLDVQQTKTFFAELKRAIAQKDKKKVSAMVAFPTEVDLKGIPKTKIRTREEFEKYYDEIINENVFEAVQNQSYDELFVNWRGLMIGNGQIWFSAFKGPSGKFDQFRIIKVNN
jgi:cyclopropane fatty-acyl-phospholipid synthase-like methyltransferase